MSVPTPKGKLDWLLHFAGEYAADAAGGVRLKNDGAEALVRVLYPPGQIHEDTGLADHDPDKKVPYLVFRPQTHASLQQFIAAIDLNSEAPSKYELIEDPTYIGVRIQTADAVEEFYMNRRAIASPGTMVIRIGEWTTDAYLLHLRRANGVGADVDRFFCKRMAAIFAAEIRATSSRYPNLLFCWSPGDPLEVFSDDASFSIQVAAEHPPRNVRWNDRPVSAEFDRQKNLVSLNRTGVGGSIRD